MGGGMATVSEEPPHGVGSALKRRLLFAICLPLVARAQEKRDNEFGDQQLCLNGAALLYPPPPERTAPQKAGD